MKHYGLKGRARTAIDPKLFFEVKFDLRDVRSGYHGAFTGTFQGEWLEDPELQWTADMVRPLSTGSFEEIAPPSQVDLPQTLPDKIVHYCLRHYHPVVWKNYELELYSEPHESREEFLDRCREELLPKWKSELQKVGDMFLHRFLEMEQRFLAQIEAEDLEPQAFERTTSRLRILFSRIRDDFSRWVQRNNFELLKEVGLDSAGEVRPEFRERVESLRSEFVARYNAINRHYEERAAALERYEVPVSFANIEIVSKGILWR